MTRRASIGFGGLKRDPRIDGGMDRFDQPLALRERDRPAPNPLCGLAEVRVVSGRVEVVLRKRRELGQ